MKYPVKLRLAAAVSALALGGGLSTNGLAAPALDAALGANLQTGPLQTGDVLLFPYYTVRNDADGTPLRTTFTVTNTGNQTLVVKFRLRDHVNSRDVLDFLWVMSPFDEVVAFMDRAPNGQPRVNFPTGENTCHVPTVDNNTGSTTSYTAPGGIVSAADAQEGHLEVIGMIALDPALTPGAAAVHQDDDGEPLNCGYYDQVFLALAGPAITARLTADGDPGVDVPNVLRGAFSITSQGGASGGFSGGDQALAIANWSAAPFYFGQNAQAAPPTLLDGSDTSQWDHPHLGDSANTANIDGFSLAAERLINNWSTNPANGVGIDWVVTYFTKHLYRDNNGDYGGPGWPVVNPLAAPIYTPAASPWTVNRTGGTTGVVECISFGTAEVYDREENVANIGGGVSPGVANLICNETNVLSFSRNGARLPVLPSPSTIVFSTTQLPSPFGWARIPVNPAAAAAPVAVTGFSYTKRDLGEPSAAFGAITPHTLFNPAW
jgi:hypothetical protein